MFDTPSSTPFENLQKQRKGLRRLIHAARYSMAGLRDGWQEAAFRLELMLCTVLMPLAIWISDGWMQAAALLMSLTLVLITELLNTGIESVIDRIGPEWHELSRKAKDLGSAATLLALLAAGCIWAMALYAKASSLR